MNLKTLFQLLQHEMKHSTVNCGSALHLLEHYLNKPGVISDEHKEEVNKRLKNVIVALLNVERISDWEDEDR